MAVVSNSFAPAKLGAARKMFIAVFLLSLFLPFHFMIGTVRVTPFTAYLVLGFFPAIYLWVREEYTQIVLPDYFFLFFTTWAGVSVFVHHGLGSGLEPVGLHLLQSFGAYLVGRLLIRDANSLRFLVKLVLIAVGVLLPFVIAEALTGRRLILQMASLVAPSLPPVDMGTRMGLTRAQGPFEHPILYGVFCASLLSLVAYITGKRRASLQRWVGVPAVGLASLLSLSTGALLAMNVQLGLMLWGRVLRPVKAKWRILAGLLLVMYAAVDVASSRTPFHVFVNYATFSATSSYNRIRIWEFGTAEVARNPLFGIGFNEWTRPSFMSDSMDNFWLVQAVRYGLPALGALLIGVLIILFRAGGRPMPTAELEAMRRGLIYALVGTLVAISSVHLWNATYVWLIFLFGSAVWLGIPQTDDQAAAKLGTAPESHSDSPVLPPRRPGRRPAFT